MWVFAQWKVSLLLLVWTATVAASQAGELQGRVLAQSNRAPLAGVQASIAALGVSATTDSAGKFRLASLRSGEHVLVLRNPGFTPETTFVDIPGDAVVSLDFTLREAVTSLPTRRVEGTNPADRTDQPGNYRSRQFNDGCSDHS